MFGLKSTTSFFILDTKHTGTYCLKWSLNVGVHPNYKVCNYDCVLDEDPSQTVSELASALKKLRNICPWPLHACAESTCSKTVSKREKIGSHINVERRKVISNGKNLGITLKYIRIRVLKFVFEAF